MLLRLIDSKWDEILSEAMSEDRSVVQIVCPFIKLGPVERLLQLGKPGKLQVITRFNLLDFYEGVNDVAALRLLMKNGASIRGIRNLHAKMYLFGQSQAVVTSANLTQAALHRNHEFGFVSKDPEIISGCREYFESLWSKAGENLDSEQLDEWERTVTNHCASGASSTMTSDLGDKGLHVGNLSGPTPSSPFAVEATQGFVKFFGVSSKRADRSMPVLEEVERSGCHWACTYPKGKRPRKVKDGALMFMGRLVKEPNDIMIFGRAVGTHHEPGRDDATEADFGVRPWKAKWPHYIRVHHGEFIDGPLSNGISLNDLMDSLDSDSFVPTQRNAAKGEGNKDPRRAYMQQAAVELTPEAIKWLNERLESAYASYGKWTPDEVGNLDWPDISF